MVRPAASQMAPLPGSMKFTRLPSGSNGRGTSRTVFFEMIDHSPTAVDDAAARALGAVPTVAAAVAILTVVINERRFMLDLADPTGWDRRTSRRWPPPGRSPPRTAFVWPPPAGRLR